MRAGFQGARTLLAKTTIAFWTVLLVTLLSLIKRSVAGIWRLQEIPNMVLGAKEDCRMWKYE
jgi:hypothetical protein